MDLGLQNKVALVTGGSQGLGYATAMELSREGCQVVLSARRPDVLEQAAAEIARTTGHPVQPLAADLGNLEQAGALPERAAGVFGGLDLVLVNSGGPKGGAFEDIEDSDWESAFLVNMLGPIRLIKASLPLMRLRGGGRILTVTSSGVREPIDGLVTSNTIRPGIVGLTKTLSRELGPDHILINTLAPGRFATPRVASLDAARAAKANCSVAEWQERYAQNIALGRYGDPAEFGRVAAFLLSFANTYITGASLLIDGGLTRGV